MKRSHQALILEDGCDDDELCTYIHTHRCNIHFQGGLAALIVYTSYYSEQVPYCLVRLQHMYTLYPVAIYTVMLPLLLLVKDYGLP